MGWKKSDNLLRLAFSQAMTLNDKALIALEQDFISKHAPTSGLDGLRPTIIRFYLQGLSKLLTYRFLESTGLTTCSQRTFFRWVAKNMNLPVESQAYLQSRADERTKNTKTALQEGASVGAVTGPGATPQIGQVATVPPSVEVQGQSSTSALQRGDDAKPADNTKTAHEKRVTMQPLETTLQTTEKSTHDKTRPSDEERRRMVQLADDAIADMERNSLGSTSDRALARLNQRDKDSGGGDGHTLALELAGRTGKGHPSLPASPPR